MLCQNQINTAFLALRDPPTQKSSHLKHSVYCQPPGTRAQNHNREHLVAQIPMAIPPNNRPRETVFRSQSQTRCRASLSIGLRTAPMEPLGAQDIQRQPQSTLQQPTFGAPLSAF